MEKDEYSAYLSSARWRGKRNRVLRRDRHTCQTCGAKRYLEIHHRTYKRLGREKIGDLITLCSACHAAISGSVRHRQLDLDWPTGASGLINSMLLRLGLPL